MSLNWEAYALATHDKQVFLQVGKDIKQTISQPIAILEKVKILQGVQKFKNVFEAKYAKGVVGGSARKK